MPDQVSYYDFFGSRFEKEILDCSQPELWTTDYSEKGRIYHEIKERVEIQKELFLTYFHNKHEVLDIGCGFGRQAVVLAKLGYQVTGIDTSPVFISIAKKLFDKYGYRGKFFQTDLLSKGFEKKFNQIILLDVLEHIRPRFRRRFFLALNKTLLPGAILIISLPKVRPRLLSKLNNRFRKAFTQHFKYFVSREEHPYPIPGKQELLKLTAGICSLISSRSSADTDFYIMELSPGKKLS